MSLGKSILMGIIGEMYKSGVEVDVLDISNPVQQKLYVTVPNESYTYNEGKVIYDAKSYVTRIKETWMEMGILKQNAIVKYKTRNVTWTKEIGETNYNNHRDDILDLIFPMKT